MAQQKVSDKQYYYLRELYREIGKKVTPEVEKWLSNLPADQATQYIEKWRAKKIKRANSRQAFRGNK